MGRVSEPLWLPSRGRGGKAGAELLSGEARAAVRAGAPGAVLVEEEEQAASLEEATRMGGVSEPLWLPVRGRGGEAGAELLGRVSEARDLCCLGTSSPNISPGVRTEAPSVR